MHHHDSHSNPSNSMDFVIRQEYDPEVMKPEKLDNRQQTLNFKKKFCSFLDKWIFFILFYIIFLGGEYYNYSVNINLFFNLYIR